MNPQDFRLLHRLRVRWAEVDMQKVVFNAHYLMYFDSAIEDYWRALALPYDATMLALDGDLFVRKATLDYHGSARGGDLLDVGMRCSRVGRSSITFAAAVFRGNDLLVSGEIVYVFTDRVQQRPRGVPDALRAILLAWEAGERPWMVVAGDWDTVGKEAWDLRVRVFVDEQRIPSDREWDGADAGAVHAIACNRLGRAVATARLLQAAPRVGQIGRMAVEPALRGMGFGRAVLQALVDAAGARGDAEVLLHAQCRAEAFYLRCGFVPRGKPFDEVGIAHIEMVRWL